MINAVRNTVLSVLNKNNYGYISPQDFNLYAQQAQMEVFEDLYYQSDEIDVDIFSVTADLTHITLNTFTVPTAATTGSDYYNINKILCYDMTTGAPVYQGEAELVSQSKITLLNNSNLTAPTRTFPAYTLEGDVISVYPADVFNVAQEVEAQYIRYPLKP